MRIVAELVGFAVLVVVLFAGARAIWQRTDVKNFFEFLKQGDDGVGPVDNLDPNAPTQTTRRTTTRRTPPGL